jgi:hypothetical protein
VHGRDKNNCKSRQHACKTIGHAISLASSGDSIMVAAATYTENLIISFSLRVIGSGAATTIIDGGHVNTVITISNANTHVTLSKVTIRNGYTQSASGGIYNSGTLAINNSTISGNTGGGIYNFGTGALTINNSTISGNTVRGGIAAVGGGIYNDNGGTLTINNSAISGNTASGGAFGFGGGIYNRGALTINNSTISGNTATAGLKSDGGGIYNFNSGALTINNSTISANSAKKGQQGSSGGDIYNGGGVTTLQNSIVAYSTSGGNCGGNMTSKGYNLSSDGTCNFNNSGDLNNTHPKLGQLGNHGGPTQTIPLLSGSPAIDAGNPSGCTDGQGHLLKTDQRGRPRPDKEDTGGCDMGAYERQKD